jgi:hypothetical protein
MSELQEYRTPWTAEDISRLRDMAPTHSIRAIADTLRRSQASVATKALQEKIRFSSSRPDVRPQPQPNAAGKAETGSLMKARWVVGFWKVPKATVTFHAGDEHRLPADYRTDGGGWSEMEPAPGFTTADAEKSIAERGYYIWPQTIVD